MATRFVTRCRQAITQDIPAIVAISNEAFMADAFFKKPEYIVRFSEDDVIKMFQQENAMFMVANNEENDIVGSLHLTWSTDRSTNDSCHLQVRLTLFM
jgi:hypothetical protein